MLKQDFIEEIKASLLTAIKNELVETYSDQFGDYTDKNGNTCFKVYWSDTSRFQPKYPYCTLTPHRDRSEGKDEIRYFEGNKGKFFKRTITRTFMAVTITVVDMGDENSNKSSLKADNFAHKVTRQLRKYFNGDEMLEWFGGNTYYDRQISVVVDTDITPTLDWSDTDTFFRYAFDIILGWDEYVDEQIDKARGAKIDVYDENATRIDEVTIKIQ